MGNKRDPKDDFLQIFQSRSFNFHSHYARTLQWRCTTSNHMTKEHLNISIMGFGKKKSRTPSLTKNVSTGVVSTCPQYLQGEHIKCGVWSVEQPALVENASLKVCSVILLTHLKRYGVHAFNRESYYLLQTSMQVGVTSMMGAHIKERNFIGLENCNFRSPRSPHSFAQSTILIWLVHPHPLFGPLLVFNISNIVLIIPTSKPVNMKSEQHTMRLFQSTIAPINNFLLLAH